MIWTIVIVLPFAPLSYLPPIMIGGGPGTWFLLGYVLYLAIGVGGFAGFSAFLFTIELHEGRVLDDRIMLVGLVLLCLGITAGSVLLGVAGAIGGYDFVIQHDTSNVVQGLLSPYVDPITVASFAAVAGAGISMYGMITAKAKQT